MLLLVGVVFLLHEAAAVRDAEHWRGAHVRASSTSRPSALPLSVLESISRVRLPPRKKAATVADVSRRRDDRQRSHVACGPLASAKEARKALGEVEVLYAEKESDVACWLVALKSTKAEELKGFMSHLSTKKLFFSIDRTPALFKMSPGLLESTSGVLQPAKTIFENKNGLLVTIQSDLLKFVKELRSFLKADDDLASIVDELEVCGDIFDGAVCDQWRQGLEAAKKCEVKVVNVGKKRLRLLFPHIRTSEGDSCTLATIAFVAAKSEVQSLDAPAANSLFWKRPSVKRRLDEKTLDLITNHLSQKTTRSVPLNAFASMALQGGTISNETPLWDLGLTGLDQLIQVPDTGVDDASCWLRETCSSATLIDDDSVRCELTGSFNSERQISRSTYSNPVTDLSLRKVVQYVSYPAPTGTYAYDSASGHGTHVAGTVAGNLAETKPYDNCSSVLITMGYSNTDGQYEKVEKYTYQGVSDVDFYYYSATLGNYFYRLYSQYWVLGTVLEGTGSYSASFCDVITVPDLFYECTFSEELVGECFEETKGVAYEAKILAFDFGDAEGNLDTPTDLYEMMYPPAFDAGARISSNSWGGGYSYDAKAKDVDDYVYDHPEFLIVFAAGNDGDLYGAYSISSPGLAKNCLTVGAAENAFPVLNFTAVASFSSRGPTLDGRIKPDVIAPGDALWSAAASGSSGLATCSVTEKQGTSMAAPAIAGLAALIRQFLIEGHHRTYSSNGVNASQYNETQPSAALVKAMLIASTQAATYGYDTTYTSIDLASYYAKGTNFSLGMSSLDFHQGFGMANAPRVLPQLEKIRALSL